MWFNIFAFHRPTNQSILTFRATLIWAFFYCSSASIRTDYWSAGCFFRPLYNQWVELSGDAITGLASIGQLVENKLSQQHMEHERRGGGMDEGRWESEVGESDNWIIQGTNRTKACCICRGFSDHYWGFVFLCFCWMLSFLATYTHCQNLTVQVIHRYVIFMPYNSLTKYGTVRKGNQRDFICPVAW